ncbi:TonB-dependent siderophore receptor [Opitutales bacterium]|nr:TonB-dependent siderophore receptor [Opitutales bacterium]
MKYKNKLLLPMSAMFALATIGHSQNNAPELSPLSVVGSKSDASTLSSGMKTSMPIKDIPQSLSIMTSEQIKAQGLKSIGDVIDYTPGVNTSQGEGHRDAAVIRGVRTTQDFYRDGIRDDVQYYRPLYNIDQVEVLRGPNALLSGFGGAYGIINRVSKKGVIGESFNTVSGSIDTFGETNVQLDSNYKIGDNQAFRINMFGESLENHRDYYYGDSFGVNPTMKYLLGDGSTLDLSYEYLNQERFIDRGIPTGSDGKPVESLKDFVFGDPTENYSTHEAHIFKAIYEHELTDSLSGRLSVSHSDHDKLYQNLYASSYDDAAGTVKLDGYVDTTQRETTTFSYQVNGEFEMGDIVHNLIAGLEFIETSNDNDRYNADWTPDDNADSDTETFTISRLMVNRNSGVNSSGNTTVNNYTTSINDKTLGDLSVVSAYLLDEIELTDSLDLVLGVRFDKMDYDVKDVKNSANYTDSDDTISPRAGIVFDVTDNTAVYASYSESYQQIKGDQYASLNAYDNKSDPNTFENTEFGVKYDLPNGLSFSAAFFNVEANKPQTNDNGATFYKEKSDVSGFELQILGALTDKWYLIAGYTSLDAESSTGGRLREAPEDMFSIWNNYLLSDRLAVNLGVIYQGESQIGSSTTPVLPDYTRVDVGATYALTDNTRLQVNIENLTDEVYFPNSHSTHQASVGAPVNATFGITSSF